MLQTYKYIDTQIQALHGHAQTIVELWCSANPNQNFDISLITDNDLKELIEDIDSEYFAGLVEEIYNDFKTINGSVKDTILIAFEVNNEIEGLCNGHYAANEIMHYTDLSRLVDTERNKVSEKINRFFVALYNNVLNRKIFVNKYASNKKIHFDEFCRRNGMKYCPFCGLALMESQFSSGKTPNSGRNAYDHYLSKDVYPFTSVNFYNLAPMCDPCNSRNKSVEDPIFADSKHKRGQRKSFYPFSTNHPPILVSISISSRYTILNNLEKRDLVIDLQCQGFEEQVETWNQVFNIKNRYAAAICQMDYWLNEWNDSDVKPMNKTWIQILLDEFIELIPDGISIERFIEIKLRKYDRSPYNDHHFLKSAFIRHLSDIGMIQRYFVRSSRNTTA